jgi:hypothetical protein
VGEEVYLLLLPDLGTRWGEWSACASAVLWPWGKYLWYPLDGKLGGFIAVLNGEATGNILCLCQGLNSSR